MAQLAMGVAGAAVGSFFGAPQLGFMAGSLLGGFLFGGSGSNSEGPRLNDLSVSSSAYGAPIPIIYGTYRVAGNVFWSTNIEEQRNKVSSHGGLGGGKGGRSGSSSSTTYTYKASFAVGLCEGPISDVIKVWADGKLIFDSTGSGYLEHKKQYNFFVYHGDEAQVPHWLMRDWVSTNVPAAPNGCPAYRGIAYLFFDELPLADFGNRIPSISAEVVVPTGAKVASVVRMPLLPDVTETGGGDAAYDVADGLLYQCNGNGIDVFDCHANRQIRHYGGIDLSMGIVEFSDLGVSVNTGIDLSPDGRYLYVYGTCSRNTQPVFRLDTTSMSPDRTFGVISNQLSNDSSHIVAGTTIRVIPFYTGSGYSWVQLYISVLSDWAILDRDLGSVTSDTQSGVQFTHGGMSTNTVPVIGKIANDGSGTEVWIFNWYRTDTVIDIFKLTVYGSGACIMTDAGSIDVHSIDPTWSDGFAPLYIEDDDTILVVCSGHGSAKLAVGSWNVIWTSTATPYNYHPIQRLTNGQLSYVNVTHNSMVVIDSNSGAVLETYADSSVVATAVNTHEFFDAETRSVIYIAGNKVWRIYENSTKQTSAPVADIVADVCARVGIDSSLLDVTKLTDTCDGYAITRNCPAKDVIQQLQQAFFFDFVETDFMLRAIPINQSVVAVIPQADLASPSNKPEDGIYWEHKRQQEIELPRAIILKFANTNLDYQVGTARSSRLNYPANTTWSKKESSAELPIAMVDTDAQQLSERMLYTIWQERDSYTTKLGWQYLWLDPGDSIAVTLDNGDYYTVRITQVDAGADYTMKVHLVGEDGDSYSSTAIGASPTFIQQVIADISGGTLLMFNVPLLQNQLSSSTTSCIVFAVGNRTAEFAGGTLMQFTSPSAQPINVATAGPGSTWGVATTKLKSNRPSYFSPDHDNTVTISLSPYSTVPSSCSMDDLLNGVNAAMLGQELIQFQTVAVNADGTITLSNLLRGRRGTEWAIELHAVNDYFVLLDSNANVAYIDLSQRGATGLWGIVPDGMSPDTAQQITFKPYCYDWMPWAPTGLGVGLDSAGNFFVGWNRRSRIGSTSFAHIAPMVETTESYECYILSAGYDITTWDPIAPPTDNVIRKFTSSTTRIEYTVDMMATDGFDQSVNGSHIVVFQISGTVGRGFPLWQSFQPIVYA